MGLCFELDVRFRCNYSVHIFAGFLSIGLLQLDGVGGHAGIWTIPSVPLFQPLTVNISPLYLEKLCLGWRWLFLIEAMITFSVGFITFWNMPASPTQTRTWFRPKGWFTEREEVIMTNRILRDDPASEPVRFFSCFP